MFLIDKETWRPHFGEFQLEVVMTIVQIEDEVPEIPSNCMNRLPESKFFGDRDEINAHSFEDFRFGDLQHDAGFFADLGYQAVGINLREITKTHRLIEGVT